MWKPQLSDSQRLRQVENRKLSPHRDVRAEPGEGWGDFLRDEVVKKQRFILTGTTKARAEIIEAILNAPEGFVVEIKPLTRTDEQNSRFHATCGDVAKQALFNGRQLVLPQWKVLFISGHAIATGLGADMVEGLEGEMVNIRESSAQMGIKRMASLIEYTTSWAVGNDVRLRAPKQYWGEL